MKKVAIFPLLFCSLLLVAMPVVHGGIAPEPEAVATWFQNLRYQKEKVTKLHFYFHDIQHNKNPTAIAVAQANSTLTSPTVFGLLNMADEPLTMGPDLNSTLVGRAQGIYGAASMEGVAYAMYFNFVFTSGEYNGSTLSLLGHNAPLDMYREMSIVGGSGLFRLARGIATAHTHGFNLTGGAAFATVEYNVVVIHY